MDDTEKRNTGLAGARTVLAIVVLILAAEVGSAVGIFNLLGEWDERGNFGDMFGAINSLFSGLALAGVVYAILLQREELSLQRDELKLTREELERAASAQEETAALLREQGEKAEIERREVTRNARIRALPRFRVWRAVPNKGMLDFALENRGASIADLEVICPEGVTMVLKEAVLISTGEPLEAMVSGSGSPPHFYFLLHFTDERDERRALYVEYSSEGKRLSTAEMPFQTVEQEPDEA